MKKNLSIFLQIITALIGIGVLILMLWEPRLEGRNVNATFFEIYFKDPFLAYAYLGSIPFFIGLYQVAKILGYAGENQIFSQATANALRIMKYCAFITAGAIVAADIYLAIAARTTNEDPAGAIMLGIIATITSLIVGTVAAKFEKTLHNVLYKK